MIFQKNILLISKNLVARQLLPTAAIQQSSRSNFPSRASYSSLPSSIFHQSSVNGTLPASETLSGPMLSDRNCGRCSVRHYGSLDIAKPNCTVHSPFFHLFHENSVASTKSTYDREKGRVAKILLENNIPVQKNSVLLVQATDILSALKVLLKKKILIRRITLWRKEGDVSFEIYWKKGLDLENSIRELSAKSSSSSLDNAVSFAHSKCAEFVKKEIKDLNTQVEYFGLVI